MERGGGIITLEDLDRYTPVWREPVRFDYRGYAVHSMPPPSSGGLTMAAIANMVERWDLGTMGWNTPETIHIMAESFRRAYADRNEYLADMDDFAAKPGTPNQFGLVQGERNAVGPGKRMLSAMSPTIAEDADGNLFLLTGTPGGATIITTVLQSIMNIVDYGMNVVQAVHAPRVHHQHLPDLVFYEHNGLPAATVQALEALGHTVRERDPGPPDAYFAGGMSGDVQMIVAMPDGSYAGWSDPRRGGRTAGRQPALAGSPVDESARAPESGEASGRQGALS